MMISTKTARLKDVRVSLFQNANQVTQKEGLPTEGMIANHVKTKSVQNSPNTFASQKLSRAWLWLVLEPVLSFSDMESRASCRLCSGAAFGFAGC